MGPARELCNASRLPLLSVYPPRQEEGPARRPPRSLSLMTLPYALKIVLREPGRFLPAALAFW